KEDQLVVHVLHHGVLIDRYVRRARWIGAHAVVDSEHLTLNLSQSAFIENGAWEALADALHEVTLRSLTQYFLEAAGDDLSSRRTRLLQILQRVLVEFNATGDAIAAATRMAFIEAVSSLNLFEAGTGSEGEGRASLSLNEARVTDTETGRTKIFVARMGVKAGVELDGGEPVVVLPGKLPYSYLKAFADEFVDVSDELARLEKVFENRRKWRENPWPDELDLEAFPHQRTRVVGSFEVRVGVGGANQGSRLNYIKEGHLLEQRQWGLHSVRDIVMEISGDLEPDPVFAGVADDYRFHTTAYTTLRLLAEVIDEAFPFQSRMWQESYLESVVQGKLKQVFMDLFQWEQWPGVLREADFDGAAPGEELASVLKSQSLRVLLRTRWLRVLRGVARAEFIEDIYEKSWSIEALLDLVTEKPEIAIIGVREGMNPVALLRDSRLEGHIVLRLSPTLLSSLGHVLRPSFIDLEGFYSRLTTAAQQEAEGRRRAEERLRVSRLEEAKRQEEERREEQRRKRNEAIREENQRLWKERAWPLEIDPEIYPFQESREVGGYQVSVALSQDEEKSALYLVKDRWLLEERTIEGYPLGGLVIQISGDLIPTSLFDGVLQNRSLQTAFSSAIEMFSELIDENIAVFGKDRILNYLEALSSGELRATLTRVFRLGAWLINSRDRLRAPNTILARGMGGIEQRLKILGQVADVPLMKDVRDNDWSFNGLLEHIRAEQVTELLYLSPLSSYDEVLRSDVASQRMVLIVEHRLQPVFLSLFEDWVQPFWTFISDSEEQKRRTEEQRRREKAAEARRQERERRLAEEREESAKRRADAEQARRAAAERKAVEDKRRRIAAMHRVAGSEAREAVVSEPPAAREILTQRVRSQLLSAAGISTGQPKRLRSKDALVMEIDGETVRLAENHLAIEHALEHPDDPVARAFVTAALYGARYRAQGGHAERSQFLTRLTESLETA
ncbi:MAG: hypothetical protein ACNA8W_15625, partial [Bradymonadaceae bacterium]